MLNQLIAAFRRRSLARAALLIMLLPVAARGEVGLIDDSDGAGFPLVRAGIAADIVIPANGAEVVRIAARDLAEDIAAVSGIVPTVREASGSADADAGPTVAIIVDPELAGRWEAFRISATSATLTIAGADARGLAFGIYELSRRIGVSPWSWWADAPIARRDALALSLGTDPIDQPAVRYRGVFLNDEGWGLVPWASHTFEPELGNLGPKTYARIFELLLRLRGNAIWPAMHPGTTPFHQVPGNAAAADAYAIVVGSSHAEPMLRNNVGEWTQDKDLYNYMTNRAGVLEYWEERVRQRTSGESLFTLGMRGIHDSSIVGPKTQAERIAALEEIIAEQRALLARHLGEGDPTRVAQIFCPYKEVLADYDAGLKVPEDVTIVWPDDNFGYIRRFASPQERQRDGGLGVYYHLSYLGAPLSWLWFDSLSPALVWSEMTRAYEHGAREVWIGNVGDLKAHELSTEFFLELAWNADRAGPEMPARFLRSVAVRDFGAEQGEAIAAIWARHQHLSTARKPEHLQWHLPLTPYAPTTLTEDEMHERLEAYASLLRDAEAVAARLPAEAQDAYYQRVGYPVAAAAAANERYFRAELARLQLAQGQPDRARETYAASEAADRRIAALTQRYNEEIANGKWRRILTAHGVAATDWRRFQPEPIPPLDSSAQEAVKLPEPRRPPEPPELPADIRAGDFFEAAGVVSINAGHFTSRSDAASGAGWRSIEGLGRTGSAVTVLPAAAEIAPSNAPSLEYRFHVATGGPATLRIRLLPTHPVVAENGIRFALSIDGGEPLPVAITTGFDTRSLEWKERVLSNATEATLELAEPLEPGWHSLRLIAVDTGVVVDKIVIDLGGLQPSYDGPPETRHGN